jgi:hypothetical protein
MKKPKRGRPVNSFSRASINLEKLLLDERKTMREFALAYGIPASNLSYIKKCNGRITLALLKRFETNIGKNLQKYLTIN